MACRMVLLACLVAAGLPARAGEAPPARPGVVFLVGGVGGLDVLGPAALRALPRAGVRHDLKEFVWTHGTGQVWQDLQNSDHQIRKAEELAELVRQVREEGPDRPIYLVGKSGGAGIVLAAARLLPAATLERIILLAPAVSPGHDLRPALRATRQEIVSFYSSGDWLVLGWGTTWFGTMDRVHGPSAGLVGFRRPAIGDDLELYNRLIQVRWTPDMVKAGHTGGHLGTSLPAFLAREVAPWLK